jgi:hypothetical protein
MQAPVIRSAVPKRRYQLGDFGIVVLGEIDSGDGVDYRHVLALIRDGEDRPFFYVTAERGTGSAQRAGVRLHVIAENGEKDLGADEAWSDLERFIDAGIGIVIRAFGIEDEPLVELS